MKLHQNKFEFLCYEPYLSTAVVRLFNELPFAYTEPVAVYSADETIVRPTKLTKDLGITVTPDYDFKAHINLICSKAGMKLSWILSVFKSRSSATIMTLYKSLVRSQLEYCCPLWSPRTIVEIQKLEGKIKELT